MQLLITHGSMSRTRVVQMHGWQIVVSVLALLTGLLAVSGTVYHFVFLKAAREGWPVVSPLVGLIVRDEVAQRDRFMRDNLDALAHRLGEMQAKLVKLEAIGERVSGMAGVKPEEVRELRRPLPASAPAEGRGGPYLPLDSPSLEQLQGLVVGLDERTDQDTDLFMLTESRLMETRLSALMVPSASPVEGVVGSGFGVRADPFTHRMALHTGLDFPAEPGTTIRAAAGGMVTANEIHPAYGHVLEIDHGNGLTTRYAHCSSIQVAVGALVRRGQPVAKVGNTGRSTGPHLHFEVLLDGAPQNPARFLARAAPVQAQATARTPPR